MASDNWSIKGNYFESCTCDLICPCIVLKPPTTGTCTALLGWHIDEGHLDDLEINDLNVSMFLQAPGLLTEGGFKVALYVDERASEAQFDAITQMYSGQLGGHLAVVCSLVGEVVSVKQAPIEYSVDGKTRRLKVGDGIGESEVVEVEGADGGQVIVSNPPLAIAPGNDITISDTVRVAYNDNGVTHEHSGTVSLASNFTYGPD